MATLPSVSAMSALNLPDASSCTSRSAISDGAIRMRGLITPVRHSASSASTKPPTTRRR
jgi:hypothetical protein